MKQYKSLFFIFILFVFFACDKDSPENPTNENFLFEDGFETQNNLMEELFPSNGSRWSNLQRSNPTNATNQVSISSTTVLEGQNALKIISFQSDSSLSKMDIEKGGFTAYTGNKVIIKADFYINSSANIENLFLMDLECCSCWDPTVDGSPSSNTDNKCPGIRLKMSGGNDYLSIERGKISASTITQTTFQFPRNEWVNVQWELTLSDDQNGLNRLLINGIEVISSNGMNMPNAQIFQDLFAQESIHFTLQEPVFYERVQIGATANPTAGNVELFVDNFSVFIEK